MLIKSIPVYSKTMIPTRSKKKIGRSFKKKLSSVSKLKNWLSFYETKAKENLTNVDAAPVF